MIEKKISYVLDVGSYKLQLTEEQARELYKELKVIFDVCPAPVTTIKDYPPTWKSPVWYPPTWNSPVWYSQTMVETNETGRAAGPVDTITITSNYDNYSLNLGETK